MRTIGCVSYLNAKPLIAGIDGDDGIRVLADVPSRPLQRLPRYDLGRRELKAITTFWQRCHHLGPIEELRPLSLYGTTAVLNATR